MAHEKRHQRRMTAMQSSLLNMQWRRRKTWNIFREISAGLFHKFRSSCAFTRLHLHVIIVFLSERPSTVPRTTEEKTGRISHASEVGTLSEIPCCSINTTIISSFMRYPWNFHGLISLVASRPAKKWRYRTICSRFAKVVDQSKPSRSECVVTFYCFCTLGEELWRFG